MKRTVKFTSVLVLALAMLVAMASVASAVNVTIEGGAQGSEYSAYKILSATDGGDGKFAYTLNDKYTAILQTISGKTEQADIVDYLEEQETAEETRALADALYAAIVAADIDADDVTDNDVFENLDQGYYLIAETKLANEADTFSLVMLRTAGKDNIPIETKEDLPSVEKKIEEKNDSTGDSSWGDHADFDIGDSINYRITGTVSENYAEYKSYYYRFVDTMDAGLTYNKDAKVYLVNGEDKVEVTEQFTIVETENNGFTVTANLKELTDVNIVVSTKIVVEYSATLNANAVHGIPGNENVVYLEYENNPYHTADGNPATPDRPGDETPDNPDDDTPGKTVEDINVVFTFKSTVNKVDKDGEALNGAGFTLYKEIYTPAAEEGGEATYAWEAVGEEIKGVTTFNFLGLDAGNYKLVETTIPAGYNKCDDVVFEVAATYDLENTPPTLIAMEVKDAEGVVVSEGDEASFTVVLDDGEIITDVVNVSGSELPSTGGMGTTIIYILGGVLLVGGLVAFITVKRMRGSDN